MKRGAFLAAFLAAPGIAQSQTEIKRLVRECSRLIAVRLSIWAMRVTPDDDVERKKRS